MRWPEPNRREQLDAFNCCDLIQGASDGLLSAGIQLEQERRTSGLYKRHCRGKNQDCNDDRCHWVESLPLEQLRENCRNYHSHRPQCVCQNVKKYASHVVVDLAVVVLAVAM